MRIVPIVIVAICIQFSDAKATESVQLGTLELRWLCTPHAPECVGIAAVGDTALHWAEKTPFFNTKSPTSWSECQHFGDSLLCVTLNHEDQERLNSFATPAHRRDSVALVYKGKVIAIVGFVGPANGPLHIGGSGGAMSTGDVEAFLKSGP